MYVNLRFSLSLSLYFDPSSGLRRSNTQKGVHGAKLDDLNTSLVNSVYI